MKELESFKELGFVHLKNFIPISELDALKADISAPFIIQCKKHGIPIDDIESGIKKLFELDHASFLGAVRLAQHSLKLHQMSCMDLFISKLKDLGLENPYYCMKPIVFFNSKDLAKEEFHFKTPIHQDWRSMQGSLDSMVVWFPLVDIDIPIGALKVVPGSHKKGLLPSEDDPWYQKINETVFTDNDFVSVEMKKGDALFFSAFLVHKSGDNLNGKVRWSGQFRFNNATERTFVERDFANPYVIYRPQKDLITQDFPKASDIETIFGGHK